MAYHIFRRLKTNELVLVARRETLEEAEELIRSLDVLWPGNYSMQKLLQPDEVAATKKLPR